MGRLQGLFRGVLLFAFSSLSLVAASRAEPTVEATAPNASPQHAVDGTNQTQAGGGVVSQKVAKFTADDFTA